MEKHANTYVLLLFKSLDLAVGYLTKQICSSGQNLWPAKETQQKHSHIIIQYSLTELDVCNSIPTYSFISFKVTMNFCSFCKASISDEVKK